MSVKRIKGRQFGSTLLRRGICENCGDSCFITNGGLSSCCGAKTQPFNKGTISKETIGTKNRGRTPRPLLADRNRILEEQNYKCYWCGRPFDSWVVSPRGAMVHLMPVWDHYIPFVITSSNSPDQFVASCRLCNSYKHASVPDVEDETALRKAIYKAWIAHKWEDL